MEKQKKVSITFLNMIKSVVTFALAPVNQVVTNMVIPFKDGINYLSGNYDTIMQLRQQAKQVITGYAAQKKSMRNLLTITSYNIMKSVYAFAVKSKDQNLQNSMHITKTALRKMKFQDFMDYTSAAITTVNGVVNKLADYHVTAQTITDWQLMWKQLNDLKTIPNNAINTRKAINTQAATLYDQSLTFIQKVLDPVSFWYAANKVDYFNEYRNNRRLKGSSTHTKCKFLCLDDLKQPIYGITVMQDGSDNKGQTDINGICSLQIELHKDDNVYSFTLSNGSIEKHTGNIEIKKGHTVSLTIEGFPHTAFSIPNPVNNNNTVHA